MSDLVERLYDRCVCSPAQNSCRNDYVCEEAAAEIRRLRAKVEKADALAEAFEDFNEKIDKARAPVGSARIAATEALAAYRESDT